jgi:hypothetical protein
VTGKSFPGARQLLRWVHEDLQSLEAASHAFLGSQPYTPVFEPDPESGDVFLKLRMAAVPDEICKLASHALWDIKHALDHATCSAVRSIKGEDIGDLHFPIASHPNDLEAKLRHIPKSGAEFRYPAGLHDIFRSFEPYPTGNGYAGGCDEFVALSKLANTTKHAIPLAAVPRFDIAHLSDTGGCYKIFLSRYPDRVGLWDGTKQELTIGLARRNSEMKMNLQFASFVALSEVALFEGYSAGEVLTGYATAAEGIVSALENAVFA